MRNPMRMILCAILVLALFVACTPASESTSPGSDSTDAATAQPTPTAKPNDDDGDATGGEESNFNPTGLPVVNEPVTISVLTVRALADGDTFTQGEFFTQLRMDTNVEIEWQIPWQNDWDEQRAIMFASGDLPDVLFGSMGFTDLDILRNLDFFIPLNDLVDNYMPNLLDVFEQEPEMRKVCTALDGNIYSLPKRLLARPMASSQPFINQVWLDNLNLEIPDTIEDLYDVLKAFKEQDANGNGDPNDEIPMTGFAGTSYFSEWNMLTLFGARANGDGLAVRDGVVTFVPTTEEWKEGTKFQNRIFSDGLWDNEYFTQDRTMSSGKSNHDGDCIVGLAFAWTPDSGVGKHAPEFVAIPPPAREDGQRFSTYMASNIGRNELEITIYCEYPEVVARWADQFYTLDASVQNTWGPFGVGMEKLGEGTYKMLPPEEGQSIDYRSWQTCTRDYGPKWAPENYDTAKYGLIEDNGDGYKLLLDATAREWSEPTFPNNVSYSVEQIEEIATLWNDIKTFVGTTSARWITQGGIDEEWDAYVAQLDAMGLQRLMEIRTAAYEAYIQ